MFLSTQGPNELPPVQPDSTMMFQDLHEELEKWAVFRQLPQLLKFDRTLREW